MFFLPLRFDFCEAGKAGVGAKKLPENIFPEFADKTITWKEFIDECKDRELNKYVKPIAIIDKYGSNTIKALEAFEGLTALEALEAFEAMEALGAMEGCTGKGDTEAILSTR